MTEAKRLADKLILATALAVLSASSALAQHNVDGKTTRVLDAPSMQAVVIPSFQDKWAVVIGIDRFSHEGWKFKYAQKDARDFRNYLVKEGSFAPDHVKLLCGSDATHQGIEKAFDWLARVAERKDLAVVYIRTKGFFRRIYPNRQPGVNVDYHLVGATTNTVGTGATLGTIESSDTIETIDSSHSPPSTGRRHKPSNHFGNSYLAAYDTKQGDPKKTAFDMNNFLPLLVPRVGANALAVIVDADMAESPREPPPIHKSIYIQSKVYYRS